MAADDRRDQSAPEYGDARPDEQVTMLDFSGDFLRQAQQAEDSSERGSSERHGSLEPDNSRNVTGASGGGVGAPGGADQQDGGERWGGQQSQSQGAQSPRQAVQSQSGQAFTAEEAARGTQQPQQGVPGAGDQPRQDDGEGEDSSRQDDGEGEDRSRQATQFDPGIGQQGGGWESGAPQDQQPAIGSSPIRQHMEVIGADGVHLGTVDHVDGHRIKLTKADSGMGAHQGHHHYISCGLVAAVEGDKVRLSATAANAYALEEEK